jgi:hypothetical protein
LNGGAPGFQFSKRFGHKKRERANRYFYVAHLLE